VGHGTPSSVQWVAETSPIGRPLPAGRCQGSSLTAVPLGVEPTGEATTRGLIRI